MNEPVANTKTTVLSVPEGKEKAPVEATAHTPASSSSASLHQEPDYSNFHPSSWSHQFRAEVGVLSEFGKDGTSGPMLNDGVEVEKSPIKQGETAETKAKSAAKDFRTWTKKSTESAPEQTDEPASIKSTRSIEEEPVVEKSMDPATKRRSEPVAEKNFVARRTKKTKEPVQSSKVESSYSSALGSSTSSSSTSTSLFILSALWNPRSQ